MEAAIPAGKVAELALFGGTSVGMTVVGWALLVVTAGTPAPVVLKIWWPVVIAVGPEVLRRMAL